MTELLSMRALSGIVKSWKFNVLAIANNGVGFGFCQALKGRAP